MKSSATLNGLAITAVAACHILAGGMIDRVGEVTIRPYFSEMEGIELPLLTKWAASYIMSAWPVPVGFGLAILSSIILAGVSLTESGRRFLPVLVAFSAAAALLHLAGVWFASTLPLMGGLEIGP
ncbi:hypothetical protein HAHE_09190 [Haloferula helveola]|uniref:Tripartite tricarboxylate transporter TctB family protein n=1 Tax=Haloferula helveola TaxID=490095 RepID=A0ABN6H0G8_9BACT|nr:hypothetical protein HAHE_09190 [Haloferula helveola]